MKVAWFQGDVEKPEFGSFYEYREYLSMEQILALPDDSPRRPRLRILLVPDDFDLSQMWGDDWDDAPADCNAGDPYDDRLPADHVWLEFYVGDTFSPAGISVTRETGRHE